MTSKILGPATRPCVSCPYRVDAPSGLWHPSEYAALVDYDQETPYQPIEVFVCHQAPERLCAGWCGTHDMGENLAVRIAVARRQFAPGVVPALYDYTSPVPLHPSGAAAAEHGLRDIENPGPESQRAAAKLLRGKRAESLVVLDPDATP